MNTLLHLADSALQYHRGKQTGLWGLMGIVIAFLVVAFWDLIQPVFEMLGIVSLLDRMGLIYEDAPAMTAYRILIAFLALYLILIIVGAVLLAVYAAIFAISQNKTAHKILKISLYLIFSPVLIVIGLGRLYLHMKDKKWKKEDPHGYAEVKRLEKNRDVIEIMKYEGCEEGKSNILDHKEAYQRLNRLPTEGDHFFLIGVTYDREIYMLFPRPLDIKTSMYSGYILAEKVRVKKYNHLTDKPIGQLEREPISLVCRFIRTDWNPKEMDVLPTSLSDYEFIIDPKHSEDLIVALKGFATAKPYSLYVYMVQSHYFNSKDRLMNELKKEDISKEEFDGAVRKLKDYNVANEDIVRYIWEGNNYKESI
ncbi:DMT family transporter [Aquibacillus sp. 3ASR75-11]|uniref:DMT family transporter n=1 Tax=Terrihalobacillus insolitus TaxID=2950438 RepID=A0A9X3WR62_9BACI|nr:hypothetical protein [Terrihalobacillus insolitus]MDC3424265.1 DMT family transporter [Terrihalobacillus insolitus]